MSNIKVSYTGDGSTVLYAITFAYINRDHVKVSVNGSGTTAFTFANDTTIQFNVAPANGAAIIIERETTADAAENTFFPNSSIRSSALNENFLQALFVSEEAREIAADAQLGNLTPGSIGTTALADGAVTNAKVSNTADIAPSKIAGTAVVDSDVRLTNQRTPLDGSVTTAKIANDAVITAKIANDAVITDKIADSAITQSKIGTNVLTPRVSEINGGPLAGFRNAIINGNFDIWQRGTSFTGAGQYTADRWVTARTGSTFTTSRQSFTFGQTDVPGQPSFFFRTVVTSVAGSANNCRSFQTIEGVQTLAGQQVTVSFWAKADSAKNIAVELVQDFGTGGSPSAAVTGIGAVKKALTTSWQKITHTVTLPSVAGKTIGSDSNDGVSLVIWFDAGSDFNARTDTLGQQSGTFDIAQVQVEPGPVATPFEKRPLGVEEILCYRYYYVAAGGNEAGSNSSSFYASGTTGAWFAGIYHHPTTMRVNPTRTTDTPVYGNSSNLTVANGSKNFTRWTVAAASAGRYTVSWSETILDSEL
jgi:hypothetical protein